MKAPVKEPYEKPELRVIRLTADEVLAVGCKTTGPTTAVGLGACGLQVPCVTSGS